MPEKSPKSRVRLNNVTCAYCHKPFDAGTRSEEEHVVGRKFVPKGSLAAQWNLIVNACGVCNDEKCELENDLSAIIMRPDPWGRTQSDPRLIEEARRKESARSKRTGKAVRESDEGLDVKGQIMPGVTFSANMVASPQFDPDRAGRLAFFHISAFFYLITFDHSERRGKAIPGSFRPIASVLRPDWGNAQMIGFQEMAASWPGRVFGVAANTFFKIVIRRSSELEPPLWSWALEWNHALRLVGFFGDGPSAETAFARLPKLKKFLIERGVDPEKGRYETWGRQEVPLANGDDHLFDCPADLQKNST